MLLEDFYNEVLQQLGVLAAEETAHPDDRAVVAAKYVAVFAEYDGRNVLTWNNDEDVPDEFSDPMSMLVADRLTTRFSVPKERRDEIKIAVFEAESTIIGSGQRRGGFNSPPTEYY